MQRSICLSGGADGADLEWGRHAAALGHEVIHWSYDKHRSLAPSHEVMILTIAQLEAADEHLRRANKTLKRRIPKNVYVRNLLRRNWYQVENAERVYAISTIIQGQVSGGTSWACQLFIDRHKGLPCECYVFDQFLEAWFCWKGDWIVIDQPATPYGVYAGIGTRDINEAGKEAIKRIMSQE